MSEPKVNIAIVGFQKAGTTSIQRYLAQQKDIYSHTQKEMTYFFDDEEFEKGWDTACKRYFHNYSDNNSKRVLIKHATLIRHEKSIKRLQEHNSDTKIIVCLRDPVQRAYSSYLMEKASGNQSQEFSEVVKEAFDNQAKGISDWRYNVFIKLGEYVNYIELLLKYFDSKQVYFLWIEEFHKNTAEELERIFSWLEVEHIEFSVANKQHNTYKETKSGTLSRLISKMLSEKSLLKRTFRKVVPLHLQNKLGDQLRALTKRKAKKQPLDNETKLFLENHYLPYANKLDILLKNLQ